MTPISVLIYLTPKINVLTLKMCNVYFRAACLLLNVIENQTIEGRLCRLFTKLNVMGHSLRTTAFGVTKKTAIFIDSPNSLYNKESIFTLEYLSKLSNFFVHVPVRNYFEKEKNPSRVQVHEAR